MELLMMRGLPGSGKSTKSKELAKEMKAVRVNRDLLREMLHFGKWFPQDEAGVIEMEKRIAAYYLSEEGRSVIVDDTNLSQKHEDMWKDFVNNLQRKGLTELTFKIHDMGTDVFTCIERDLVREKKVGESVIMQMALENDLMDKDIHYVLCDLDGTLADLEARRMYVKERPKNWKKFYEELPNDTLREDVLADVEATLAKARDEGKRTFFIILSARPENYRKVTEEWLLKHGVDDYSALIMRRAGDYREDSIVKRELLHRYFKDKSKIICVFDDRPRVIRMWEEEGLKVVDVGDGIDF